MLPVTCDCLRSQPQVVYEGEFLYTAYLPRTTRENFTHWTQALVKPTVDNELVVRYVHCCFRYWQRAIPEHEFKGGIREMMKAIA